jgi:hypothetical protein
MFLGLNAMDESASTETGAIVLELLLKAGVIVVEDNGKYRRGDTDKFVILHGDVKTMDNINLLQETIRKSMNGSGYSELSNQLLVFDQALSQVMDLPGDWHAGLSMLSSIVSLFYESLLKPVADMLKWKRVNKERNKCYYQTSRLVSIIHQQLLKMTWQRYVSERYGTMKAEFTQRCDAGELATGEANFLCQGLPRLRSGRPTVH